jgi:hypothetical protein
MQGIKHKQRAMNKRLCGAVVGLGVDKCKSITILRNEIKGASGGIAPCILKVGPRLGSVVNGC